MRTRRTAGKEKSRESQEDASVLNNETLPGTTDMADEPKETVSVRDAMDHRATNTACALHGATTGGIRSEVGVKREGGTASSRLFLTASPQQLPDGMPHRDGPGQGSLAMKNQARMDFIGQNRILPPIVIMPIRKGVAWNESEHLAFLKGLQVFGKGQWKQISRYYVPTRTPTQVASHAQKHFLRLAGNTKRRSKFADVEENALASGLSLNVAGQPATSTTGGSSGSSKNCGGEMDGIRKSAGVVGESVMKTPDVIIRRRASLPPVDAATGIALGIPLPELPKLQSSRPGEIPMLKVLPGRIKAVCTIIRPASPSPSQKSAKPEVSGEKQSSRMKPNKGKKSVRSNSDVDEVTGRIDKKKKKMEKRRDMSALDALAGVAAALADEDG